MGFRYSPKGNPLQGTRKGFGELGLQSSGGNGGGEVATVAPWLQNESGGFRDRLSTMRFIAGHQVFRHFTNGATHPPTPLAGGWEVSTVNEGANRLGRLGQDHRDIVDQQEIPIGKATPEIGEV